MDQDDASSVSSADVYVPFNTSETLKAEWQQHPAFHLYVSAGSFPPDINDGDGKFLAAGNTWNQPLISTPNRRPNPYYEPNDRRWTFSSYIPYWTNPKNDLRRQEDFTPRLGPIYRYVDRSALKSWRPAILPVDQSQDPTQYAIRFGIDPQAPPSVSGKSRSRLTPTDEQYQFTWQTPEEREADEGFQRLYQWGYTSSELVEIGAYDLRKEIRPPNLDGQIHPFFEKSRWTQQPWEFMANSVYWGGSWKILYKLGNDHAQYNVNSNPRVWEAMKPALHLVSKVLQSQHPVFDILGNFYHLRRVEPWRDRQDAASLSTYGHHKALYYEIDESKMYPTARLLKQYAQFDPKRAADALLDSHLKLSIINWTRDAKAVTMGSDKDGKWEVRIGMAAFMLWPLLEPKFDADADRMSRHYDIASSFLHEVAHAYHHAVDMMLTDPSHLRRTSYGQTLPDEVFRLLPELGNEMLPPYQPNDYQKSGFNWTGHLRGNLLSREQWFFQDEPKGEDGRIVDNQIWGSPIALAPWTGSGGKIPVYGQDYSPVIVSASWPGAHPQPHTHNQPRESNNPYTRWLVSPAANVWSTLVAIPSESYAAYFRTSWWDCDYRKFGAPALRMKHSDAQGRPLRARLQTLDHSSTAEIIRAFRSSPTVDWIFSTAYKRLLRTGHDILADYLLAVTSEVASAKMFRRQLHYEQRTWDQKFQVARQGMQAALDAMQTWSDHLTQLLWPTTTQITEDNVQAALEELARLLHDMAQKLLYVTQFLGQDVSYSQALAEMYLQQSTQHQAQIFRRYMQDLLTRLREVRAHATTLSERLVTVLAVEGSDIVARGGPECEFAIHGKIVTDLASPSIESWESIWRHLAGDIQSLRSAGQDVVALRAAADDAITILVIEQGASLSAPVNRSQRVNLSVARARARHPARRLRAAAMRQLRSLDPHRRPRSPRPASQPQQGAPARTTRRAQATMPGEELASRLDRIALATVRRWVHVLQVHPELAAAPGLSQMVRQLGVDDATRRAYLMTDARSLVEIESAERMAREASRRNMPLPPTSPSDSSTSSMSGTSSISSTQDPKQGGGDVATLGDIPPDPTLAEIREAIKRLAGANEADARYLGQLWTEARIQAVFDADLEENENGEDDLGDVMDGLAFFQR